MSGLSSPSKFNHSILAFTHSRKCDLVKNNAVICRSGCSLSMFCYNCFPTVPVCDYQIRCCHICMQLLAWVDVCFHVYFKCFAHASSSLIAKVFAILYWIICLSGCLFFMYILHVYPLFRLSITQLFAILYVIMCLSGCFFRVHLKSWPTLRVILLPHLTLL